MLVRILLFISFTTLSILSLLLDEIVEMRIVNYYLPHWLWASITYRIYILIQLFLAFIILFGVKNKYVFIFSFICSLIIIIDTTLYFVGFDSYFALFFNVEYKIISYCALVLLIPSLFLFLRQRSSKQIKNWIYIIALIPSVGLSFVRIVYADDWMEVADTEKSLSKIQVHKLLSDNKITIKDDNLLLPFLSTSCPHCRLAAMKLAISKKRDILPSTVLVFPEDKEDALKFMDQTKLTGISFIILDKTKFGDMAGFLMPSIYYITNESSSHYIGEQFNNVVLSKIHR